MPDFIKEIPSDTTINNLEFINTTLTIKLTFYTEETYLLTFYEVYGYKLIPGWSKLSGIESVEIRLDDIFLREVANAAMHEGKTIDDLKDVKNYSFLKDDVAVMEVIAKKWGFKKEYD
jgi:hypothetical protein